MMMEVIRGLLNLSPIMVSAEMIHTLAAMSFILMLHLHKSLFS